jgi:hypothetical protein
MGMQYDVKSAFATADAALVDCLNLTLLRWGSLGLSGVPKCRVRLRVCFTQSQLRNQTLFFMTTHLRLQELRH